ncbi:MAG: 3-mercaptopropionate dioxygenase [Burkholderiales bacterium]|nr:MAG: 3-mercaptopropionate dioxygenase [Burkholderiales bacterium]
MNTARFRTFVQEMTRLVESAGGDEARLLEEGRKLLSALVSHDDWLPEEFARPHPDHYQQYLLHCDPLERFSVVSFVWGPGQATPVHDHTVWGMVGMMRGAERCREYDFQGPGRPLAAGHEHLLQPGQVDLVSPRIGDVHQVSNALQDRPSVSIHVYGANIGAVARHVYVPETGEVKPFVSGYSNTALPNIWDRSAEVRVSLAAA